MTTELGKKSAEIDRSLQDSFYEASKDWVLSLKERHDTHDLIDILDNDPERYPYQAVSAALVPAYQPTPAEIRQAGSVEALQSEILEQVRLGADAIMGKSGSFNDFTDQLLESRNKPKHPESTLRTIWGRLQVPSKSNQYGYRHNVAVMTYHPNILVQPIYAGAIATAFSRAKYLKGSFNLFNFSRQNLLAVNPALSVASFAGEPAMEKLSKFSTVVQLVPPTRSGVSYYKDRNLRRILTYSARDALTAHLDSLYGENKSAILTVDPTGSTFELEINGNGQLATARRKPVNRFAKDMILDEFNFVWPLTMALSDKGANWSIGEVRSLANDNDFEETIEELDHATEKLLGVSLVASSVEREIGRIAV